MPCEIYGVPHRQRQQYPYAGFVWKMIDHREGEGAMQYLLGTDCNDDEVTIPIEYAVVTDVCIPAEDVNVFQYLQRRDMDKTTDYYKTVKENLGIDMTLNHVAQINPSYYERLSLKVPVVENNINEHSHGRTEE